MAFADYWSEIVGCVPRVDALFAQKLINRSWSDIRDERLWSFLRGVGVMIAPQIITAGTVSVTQFSNTVTLDNTALAALSPANIPLLTLRQLRVGLGGGTIYSIIAFNPNLQTLTLDRIYTEPTASGQPYQVYRCYFSPVDQNGNYVTDFRMWKVVINTKQGYAIVGENLRLTQQELDARDPQRSAQDVAYTVASRNVDAKGVPIFELWPHPTSAAPYIGFYQKQGQDLSNTVDLPVTISSKLVVEHAKDYAYDWAIANVGRFPELRGVEWQLLKAESNRKYERELQKSKLKDDDMIVDSFLPQLRDYLTFPPIDSKFAQSHDMGAWFDS